MQNPEAKRYAHTHLNFSHSHFFPQALLFHLYLYSFPQSILFPWGLVVFFFCFLLFLKIPYRYPHHKKTKPGPHRNLQGQTGTVGLLFRQFLRANIFPDKTKPDTKGHPAPWYRASPCREKILALSASGNFTPNPRPRPLDWDAKSEQEQGNARMFKLFLNHSYAPKIVAPARGIEWASVIMRRAYVRAPNCLQCLS